MQKTVSREDSGVQCQRQVDNIIVDQTRELKKRDQHFPIGCNVAICKHKLWLQTITFCLQNCKMKKVHTQLYTPLNIAVASSCITLQAMF